MLGWEKLKFSFPSCLVLEERKGNPKPYSSCPAKQVTYIIDLTLKTSVKWSAFYKVLSRRAQKMVSDQQVTVSY